MDWRLLGYGINEPWEERSRTQQDRFNKKVVSDASAFLTDVFVPQMEKDVETIMKSQVTIRMESMAILIYGFIRETIIREASMRKSMTTSY